IALTSTTTAEGEAARPAWPLAIPQPGKPLLRKALAPLRPRVDRPPQPPRDLDVLLAVGGLQHDPGPYYLALLSGRPPQAAPPHPPPGSRQRAPNRAVRALARAAPPRPTPARGGGGRPPRRPPRPPPLGSRQRDRKRVWSAHERLTPSSPAG